MKQPDEEVCQGVLPPYAYPLQYFFYFFLIIEWQWVISNFLLSIRFVRFSNAFFIFKNGICIDTSVTLNKNHYS